MCLPGAGVGSLSLRGSTLSRVSHGVGLHRLYSVVGDGEGNGASESCVKGGHVYFVATPLGNIQDITLRALNVLRHVDIIAAEDTRNTAKLLRLLDIPTAKSKTKTKLVAHHEHNWQQSTPELVKLLLEGKSVALVSDAGTPGVSDPGAPLAAACVAAKIPVVPVPGPSAVVSALSVSGFVGSSTFTFHGFLPVKGKERKEAVAALLGSKHVGVFFEAPHRMLQTFELLVSLADKHGGERSVVCCRELTKLHEETFRGTMSQTLAWLKRAAEGGESGGERIRGEFTIVVAPPAPRQDGAEEGLDSPEGRAEATLIALRKDGLSRSDAVKVVSGMESAGVSRSLVYKLALAMDW